MLKLKEKKRTTNITFSEWLKRVDNDGIRYAIVRVFEDKCIIMIYGDNLTVVYHDGSFVCGKNAYRHIENYFRHGVILKTLDDWSPKEAQEFISNFFKHYGK